MTLLMCAICSRPDRSRRATPGYRTCDACTDRIRDDLTEIPGQYAALTSVRAMLPESGDCGRRAPGYASTSPARDIVLAVTDWRTVWSEDDRLHHPPSVIGAWAELVRSEVNEAQPAGQADIRADAALLIRRLDHCTRQEWIVDMRRELAEVRDQLRTIAGEPRPLPIGRCPNVPDGQDTECGTPLFVREGSDCITCRVCGEQWPRARWQLLGKSIGAIA